MIIWQTESRIAFDPEGLLSCLGSIGHVLLGFYVGKMILDCKKNNELIIRNLFIFGTIIMFLGFLLSYGCPINKKLWSSTFVLTTCGIRLAVPGVADLDHRHKRQKEMVAVFRIFRD